MVKKCIILGATGYIGQQFIRLLENHPKLDLVGIYASSRSEGKSVKEFWNLPFYKLPESLSDMKILNIENMDDDFDLAFSGLPTKYANDIEVKLAKQGFGVFSNASAHRMGEDVPILIPEVNGNQAEIVKHQQEKFGSTGFITTNANCSVTGLAMYLSELKKVFPFKSVVVTTYQAMSGAGNKGVGGIEISGNVIPFIQNEEEKIAIEANKILGTFDGNRLIHQNYEIIANCARVPTIDGHLEAITVNGMDSPDLEKIREHFDTVKSPLNTENFHIAPIRHVEYLHETNRPQPAIDANRGESEKTKGMTLYVGRMRKVGKSLSSYALVHNTIRGGSGGSVLNAEYLLDQKLI